MTRLAPTSLLLWSAATSRAIPLDRSAADDPAARAEYAPPTALERGPHQLSGPVPGLSSRGAELTALERMGHEMARIAGDEQKRLVLKALRELDADWTPRPARAAGLPTGESLKEEQPHRPQRTKHQDARPRLSRSHCPEASTVAPMSHEIESYRGLAKGPTRSDTCFRLRPRSARRAFNWGGAASTIQA